MRYNPFTGRITDDDGRFLDEVHDSKGYRLVRIGGKYRQGHRVAFWLATGTWPPDEIDHRNRIKNDNRWRNIRPATKAENAQNRKVYINNRLGVRGVRLRRDGYYEPRLMLNGKAKYLGIYRTLEEAVTVRAWAEMEYFSHAVG